MKSMPLRHELRRKILCGNWVKTGDMSCLEMRGLRWATAGVKVCRTPHPIKGWCWLARGCGLYRVIIKDIRKGGLVLISSYGPIALYLPHSVCRCSWVPRLVENFLRPNSGKFFEVSFYSRTTNFFEPKADRSDTAKWEDQYMYDVGRRCSGSLTV